MPDEVKLLPCPFCDDGGDPHLISSPIKHGGDGLARVTCYGCDTEGPAVELGYCLTERDGIDEAAERWNTRVSTPPGDDEVERALDAWFDAMEQALRTRDPGGVLRPWREGRDKDPERFNEEAEILRPALRAAIAAIPSRGEAVETIEGISRWCDETFGEQVTPHRVAERANEEMIELLGETAGRAEWTEQARIEAADVVIVLCRVPGLWAAVEQKMAVNRKREWRLTGDGCGYHIPKAPSVTPGDAV